MCRAIVQRNIALVQRNETLILRMIILVALQYPDSNHVMSRDICFLTIG